MRRGPWLWLALAVILLDQASKLWVLAVFEDYEVLPVTGFFNLVLVYNEGAAFSFLADAGGWQRWFFISLALIISVVLYRWLGQLKPDERLTAAALSLILGGAWGNLIDRVLYAKVVDFLDFYYQSWHWPAFNLADSAISLGVALMLLAMLREGPQAKN
ncbi:MAG: lipoprotein signal peptidase [Gammaproteobacteria bacterium]|nr:lipoprotein signal peptidase [Gammaproteobacteria bacterium]